MASKNGEHFKNELKVSLKNLKVSTGKKTDHVKGMNYQNGIGFLNSGTVS